MGRAEQTLARVWRCGSSAVLLREAALEAALAAALEHPDVWPRLREVLRLDAYPARSPSVTTQDRVETGRTDVTLEWPSAKLVLELKAGWPPSAEQVRAYLQAGADVVAIAKHPGYLDVAVPAGRAFHGVVTWASIRKIEIPGAPLEWRQLQLLIDELEVAVQRMTRDGLQAIVGSWSVRDAIKAQTYPALEAVRDGLTRAGLSCVLKEKRGAAVKMQDQTEHGLLVWWTWPAPWDDDMFATYTGMVVARADMPPLVSGLPDLILGLHLRPDSTFGRRVRQDAQLREIADRWAARPASGDIRREVVLDAPEWTLIRARASTFSVLQAGDQAASISEWMLLRLEEWIADGLVARLAALDTERAGRG